MEQPSSIQEDKEESSVEDSEMNNEVSINVLYYKDFENQRFNLIVW